MDYSSREHYPEAINKQSIGYHVLSSLHYLDNVKLVLSAKLN